MLKILPTNCIEPRRQGDLIPYDDTLESHCGIVLWCLVITTEDDSFTDKRAMILVMGQRKLIRILPVVVRGQALACDLSKASPELRPFSSSFPPHSNKGGTWEPCTITWRDQGIKRNREESMEWPHRFQNLSSPRNLDSKLSKWNQISWEQVTDDKPISDGITLICLILRQNVNGLSHLIPPKSYLASLP